MTPRDFAALLIAATLFAASEPADATPIYSARSAQACDTCHIEPVGWANPSVKKRKCTLDCQGCHITPSGSGLRRASGYYYGRESIAMFGSRPSVHGDPEAYRGRFDEDGPGRFRIWEGFSGWKPGQTPTSEVDDKYGDIEEQPKYDLGADIRFMGYLPYGDNAPDPAFFPMQADGYALYRPQKNIISYLSIGLRAGRTNNIAPDEYGFDDFVDQIVIREMFIQAENFPYGLYGRIGRFSPPHGWRIPDHTSFIRRDEGFDENDQVFGIETGLAANLPYANLALFVKGDGSFPNSKDDPGAGAALSIGGRWIAGQAGANLYIFGREDGGSDVIIGPQWALNAYPFVYLGQVDARTQTFADGSERQSLYAYHELSTVLYRGITGQIKYDWLDADTNILDDHRHRFTLGLELNPYNNIQFGLQHRWNFNASTQSGSEFLVWTHIWL